MPSPQSGTACNLVSPTTPDAPQDAVDANPGQVEDVQGHKTQDGAAPTKPHKPDPTKTHWIEIVMLDEDKNPVTGETYRITLPDGQTVAEGTLDEKGFARVDGIDPGNCQVSFPDLDQDAWKKT